MPIHWEDIAGWTVNNQSAFAAGLEQARLTERFVHSQCRENFCLLICECLSSMAEHYAGISRQIQVPAHFNKFGRYRLGVSTEKVFKHFQLAAATNSDMAKLPPAFCLERYLPRDIDPINPIREIRENVPYCLKLRPTQ